MALADEIEELVRRKPGLTRLDLVRMLHDHAGYQQQVTATCRRLVLEGRVQRKGKGGWNDPITYYPPEGSTPMRRGSKGEKRPLEVRSTCSLAPTRCPQGNAHTLTIFSSSVD